MKPLNRYLARKQSKLDGLIEDDADLREALSAIAAGVAESPSKETAAAHLDLLRQATMEFRASGDLAPAKRKPRKKVAVRLAAATAIATASLGGMAYAGVLPDQLQDALSNAAAKAGFDLPASDNAFGARAEEVSHGQQGDKMREEHSKRDEAPGQDQAPDAGDSHPAPQGEEQGSAPEEPGSQRKSPSR